MLSVKALRVSFDYMIGLPDMERFHYPIQHAGLNIMKQLRLEEYGGK